MRGSGFIACGLLGVSLLLAGCNGSDEEFGEVSKNNAEVPEAAHGHEHGPHDGHVVELDADDVYAEIVLNAEDRTATVYVLDADMQLYPLENGATVELHLAGEGEEEVVLTGVPTPLDGETEEQVSSFQFVEIPASLRSVEEAQGHVVIIVGDKTLNGEITHDAHDHGDHDHGHDDHDDHDHDGDAGS